ncbi:hypothetical protein F8388_004236 [Cannabis sativa]|uniref:Reverse transcriptase zinc-binding domain-containing protein n=1 Tax=Cannabis sativa TaxID=3483 RepID=A0A7J6F792_CANSA|nr:hypothetical protein F8388_004236 [Cannabis sativa]
MQLNLFNGGNKTELKTILDAFQWCHRKQILKKRARPSLSLSPWGGRKQNLRSLTLGSSSMLIQLSFLRSSQSRKLCNLRNCIDKEALTEVGHLRKFKVKKFYLTLIYKDKVNYHKIVWHRLSVSKHRFILWEAINGHLLTHDLIGRFISIDSFLCHVREAELKPHKDLFFYCISLVKSFRVNKWLSSLKGLVAKFASAAVATMVYFVWCNRDRCIFEAFCGSIPSICQHVKMIVKARF